MNTVAIVGAGITGLTAAHALHQARIPFTVYESAPRAGGVIVSHREGPWLAEGGPNTILETSPLIIDLLRDLDLIRRRCDSNPAAGARYIVRGGRPVPLPGSVPGFLASSLFSWRAKFRLLAEPFLARGTGEESVAAFVQRRLGSEFLDYAIDPLVSGIYAGDPAALSIQHAFPRIHALEARYGSLIRGQIFGGGERRRRNEISKAHAKKFSFDDGLQVLPDALAREIHDHLILGTTVESIHSLPPPTGGWRVVHRGNGIRSETDHSAVLYCGTARGLARLPIDAPAAPSLAALAEIRHPPVTSVVLGFRRDDVTHPCCGFGMLIPHREGFGILGTIFSSALFPRRAPEGHLTLTSYVGGVRQPDHAHLPDGPLVDLVLRDLGRLLGVQGRPVHARLTRWPHAIPQYEVGYGRHKALLDNLEHRATGLVVAGHFRDGVALSDSILAGHRAAERVTTHLRSHPPSRPIQLSP